MLYKFITKTIILVFLILSNAYGQSQIANNVSEAIKEIMLSKEKITKKDYDSFWQKTGVKSREEKINFIINIKNNFLLIQEYNKTVWECAEKSWIANKEIECKDLQKNITDIKKNLGNSVDIEKFKEMESGFNDIIKNSAKRGKNVESVGRSKIFQEITLESIQEIKRKTNQILERANAILQPEFIYNQ
jgi:hypothetical protein